MKWSDVRQRVALVLATLGIERASSTPTTSWTSSRKIEMRDLTKGLWNHGFDAYMDNAFPMDELKPLTCRGQGPDWYDVTAIHYNDVLANCSVTLVDNIDTFVVMNNYAGFKKAVRDVINHVSFDVDTKPQVFETTIRVLGGLLSGHIFSSTPEYGFSIPNYNSELLDLAYDLGRRLLPAFKTPTGIPYARVNLRTGVPRGESAETCSAGAGSLLLEFATLSRLTGDSRFEDVAIKAFYGIWNRRSTIGLIGNTINLITGSWIAPEISGVGAGIDSFYEYALKMYVLTGETQYLDVWNDAYSQIMKHSRGRDGFWYRGVTMDSGELAANHIDSLGAFWPGLQVLAGDVESAVKSHMAYWNLWKRYSGLPETFNILTRQGISLGYPLRPEFIESTYFLYRATRDSFYLDVGERILEDLTRRAKTDCGLCTISNLLLDKKEDRMESFALSESLKYLYLLFDEENPFNGDSSSFVFTTEGHMLTLNSSHLRQPSAIRRSLRRDEQPQCPVYVAPRVALDYDWRDKDNEPLRHVGGLIGSVRERPDFEYARVLAGISATTEEASGVGFGANGRSPAVVTQEDMDWWSPYGWCEVPQVEEYTLEWVLSADGGVAKEDWAPGPDKIKEVPDGYMMLNITGVRTQVTARIDRTGYDITRIGQYRVLTGQKVYINDPAVTPLIVDKEGATEAPNLRTKGDKELPDIQLAFSFSFSSPTYPHPLGQIPIAPPESLLPDLKNRSPLEAVASTASFGGNPGLISVTPTSGTTENVDTRVRRRLLFGPESPANGAIRVVRPPLDNIQGCDDYSLDLRFEKSFGPFSGSSDTLDENEPSPVTNEPSSSTVDVLFVRRGGCTFLRKLYAAKEAGFAGVIAWNDFGRVDLVEDDDDSASDAQVPVGNTSGLVNPSADGSEEEFARRELMDVAIVVVNKMKGEEINRMLDEAGDVEGSGVSVVVEVKLMDDGGLGLLREKVSEAWKLRRADERPAQAKMLYINGLALRNTILVF